MKKTFTVSIPKPCHEKWEAFNPTTLGGFCSSCQKEVIDFTTWDEDRIKSYFKNQSQTSCGRFYPSQLKSYTLQEVPKFNFLRWTIVPLVSLMMMLLSRNAHAQKIGKTRIERVQNNREAPSIIGDTVRMKIVEGIVKSKDDGSVLPGVNVLLKGTTIGTGTDVDGKFSIVVQDPKPNDTLVFSFIGLQAELRNIYEINETPILMSLDITQLGGYDVRISPFRKAWWGVKNLFHKN